MWDGVLRRPSTRDDEKTIIAFKYLTRVRVLPSGADHRLWVPRVVRVGVVLEHLAATVLAHDLHLSLPGVSIDMF